MISAVCMCISTLMHSRTTVQFFSRPLRSDAHQSIAPSNSNSRAWPASALPPSDPTLIFLRRHTSITTKTKSHRAQHVWPQRLYPPPRRPAIMASTVSDESRLLALPMELLVRTTDFLGDDSLPTLRLTCKTLDAAVFDRFAQCNVFELRCCALFKER